VVSVTDPYGRIFGFLDRNLVLTLCSKQILLPLQEPCSICRARGLGVIPTELSRPVCVQKRDEISTEGE
jgi:hypothetical protein